MDAKNFTQEYPVKKNDFVTEFYSDDVNQTSNSLLHHDLPKFHDHDTRLDEKPFMCGVCSKGFTTRRYLNRHSIIHCKEKPFKCNICPKGFFKTHDLNIHLRIHAGEKPFKCNVCLKEFKKKGALKRHSSVHTGIKPFNCDVCSRGFFKKRRLKKHLRLHARKNRNATLDIESEKSGDSSRSNDCKNIQDFMPEKTELPF